MKLFKYLKKYWYAILAALVLLVIQAHSDLTLPSITSEIVDVGIQQGGLENPRIYAVCHPVVYDR